MTATVTSISVSTLIDPTTYFSTVLSTRVIDDVSIPFVRYLRPDTDKLHLQTMTVVDTMTATITENHTQLQTMTEVATQTETQTLTETSVVAETALAQCLGNCQMQWGLSSGSGDQYNTYASPSPSYMVTTTAASPYMTQSPSYMSSGVMSSSESGTSAMPSASSMSSASAPEASTTGCAGCSD